MRLFSISKPPSATYRRAVKNIRLVYLNAPDAMKSYGIGWYYRAHEQAESLAAMARIPVRAACHIIAALSPNNIWERNLRDSIALVQAISKGKPMHSVSVTTYTANKTKAWEIARLARKGLPYEHILKGKKVTSFAKNIEFPDEDVAVTIDFHAYSVAVGWRFTTKNIPEITPKTYAILSRAYAAVAAEFGLKAHQVQSVTWTWWRKGGQ